MTDFLLEFRSEEIPARMQAKAREDLARLFAAELAKAGLTASEITTYATPRRLALIARDLPDATQAVSEEVKGPKASAPPQALEGFLRKTGLTRDQLVERNGILFAVTQKPGRATADVLAEAIPAIIRAFPWPKSMRWGEASASTESLRWVRPLQGIVALFGEDIVPVEIAGIASGAATLGHRFHHPGVITIGGAHDYVEKLRACHVIVDQDERAAIIRERARELAEDNCLTLVEDEGLVAENAGLTEWPVPLIGSFDEAFLQVPPEVIQLTARVNQKYFVCRYGVGELANAFICTANIDATDGGATIVDGNRKVLAARLSDARFFYETDLKVPLEEQARKLEKIVFHEKLGTVADKVERVAKLARWLVEEGIIQSSPSSAGGGGPPAKRVVEGQPQAVSPVSAPPPLASGERSPSPSELGEDKEHLAALAERAARLCKADLVTGMVGEFPELQGLMGGYYAAAQGEDRQVAEAIRDHYKPVPSKVEGPVGQGDDVPTAPVTVAVSLADKLDTFFSFFGAEEYPTGSKDPFALRRAANSILSLIISNQLRCSFRSLRAAYIQIAASHDPRRPDANAFVGRATTETNASDPVFVGVWRIHSFSGKSRFDWPERFDSQPDWLLVLAEKPSATMWDSSLQRAYLKLRIDEGSFYKIVDFFADRLKVQQREAGVRHDLIDAVFALGGEDDLVRLLARVRALQAFVGTEDGANLLAGYKRAANILKKEGYSPLPSGEGQGASAPRGEGEGETADADHPHPSAPPALPPSPTRGEGLALSYTPEPCEAALHAALDSAEPAAASAVAAEDFEGAMAALASLRAPIDRFFEEVTVNHSDPAKRSARLRLLARMRDAVHAVADFSKIEG